jgi:acetylornithine deacetylase
MTETLKLLRELIAIPSVNPAYVAAGSPFAGEKRVADYIAERARRAGLEVELHPALLDRPNVLARLTPSGKIRKRILLAPHIDTVGGIQLPADFFTPRIRGKRLYGRGACDTKASVAVMLSVLEELARSPQRPANTEITFAGLVDEECGQNGSRALVKRRVKADLVIVGEPTPSKSSPPTKASSGSNSKPPGAPPTVHIPNSASMPSPPWRESSWTSWENTPPSSVPKNTRS